RPSNRPISGPSGAGRLGSRFVLDSRSSPYLRLIPPGRWSPLRGLPSGGPGPCGLLPERINRAPPMPRRETRETRPVRNGAMAVDLGEHRRFQSLRERGPTHPAAGTAGRRSGDRAVPRPSARVLARKWHTRAPSEDRGDVPRRQPGPRPRDERFVGGEPPRDVAPRRTGGRSRRHAAELHGELGPRADVRRERDAAPPAGEPELAVRSGRAEL